MTSNDPRSPVEHLIAENVRLRRQVADLVAVNQAFLASYHKAVLRCQQADMEVAMLRRLLRGEVPLPVHRRAIAHQATVG
jgi:hypothetical protein